MNDHTPIEDCFSDLFDGSLGAEERDSALAHLARCAACRASYAAFERSTRALQALRLRPTAPAHVAGILSALAPRSAPRAAPWRGLWLVLSHAAVLALGLGLAWRLRPRDAAIEAGAPEVRVVEVVREVPVERIQFVERPVASPASVDVERGYRLLAAIRSELAGLARLVSVESARREASSRAATSDLRGMDAPGSTEPIIAEPVVAATPAPAVQIPLTSAVVPAERTRPDSAPLRIVRSDDRVRIQTRGPLADIVPALIDTLEDPDAAVARAAEEHLEALRAELTGDLDAAPLAAAERPAATDRPGGLRGLLAGGRGAEERASVPDPHARWTSWWMHHSSAASAAGSL